MTTATAQPASVYLIDASIYIFQAHFSPYVECYDSDGEDISALYGFLQFLLQFLRRVDPSYLAIAHDESLFCGFRHDLCPNYKSNRELPDANLGRQLRACVELGEVFGLSSLASRKYEADDIIGALAAGCRRAGGSELAVHIVSRDKDLSQLLHGDEDCLWDYQGNRKRYRADIISEFGIRPEQFPDYLGLVGDSVDCISGVPGVGPVKARELLRRYEGLEEIYDRLEEIARLPFRGAAALALKLKEHRQLAELSKLLATIVCDLDDAPQLARQELNALAVSYGHSEDALTTFLREYRFRNSDAARARQMAERLA